MNEQELKELFKQLEEQGWNPQWCDTPVPYYDNPVMCGNPTDVGDIIMEMTKYPKSMVSIDGVFTVSVTGDSMIDAGIVKGDKVKVVADFNFYDGDYVLARIDGNFTLKVYYVDDDGRPWLVPQNEKYKAILLTEDQDVTLLGKVTDVIKRPMKVPSRYLRKRVNQSMQQMMPSMEISQLKISQAIREVAKMIDIARQWYAVYRVLVDANVIAENDFDGFIEMVRTEVPQHQHLPARDELQRMAVLSFAKPLARWKSTDAPVQGKRFTTYLNIGNKMKEILGI